MLNENKKVVGDENKGVYIDPITRFPYTLTLNRHNNLKIWDKDADEKFSMHVLTFGIVDTLPDKDNRKNVEFFQVIVNNAMDSDGVPEDYVFVALRSLSSFSNIDTLFSYDDGYSDGHIKIFDKDIILGDVFKAQKNVINNLSKHGKHLDTGYTSLFHYSTWDVSRYAGNILTKEQLKDHAIPISSYQHASVGQSVFKEQMYEGGAWGKRSGAYNDFVGNLLQYVFTKLNDNAYKERVEEVKINSPAPYYKGTPTQNFLKIDGNREEIAPATSFYGSKKFTKKISKKNQSNYDIVAYWNSANPQLKSNHVTLRYAGSELHGKLLKWSYWGKIHLKFEMDATKIQTKYNVTNDSDYNFNGFRIAIESNEL